MLHIYAQALDRLRVHLNIFLSYKIFERPSYFMAIWMLALTNFVAWRSWTQGSSMILRHSLLLTISTCLHKLLLK